MLIVLVKCLNHLIIHFKYLPSFVCSCNKCIQLFFVHILKTLSILFTNMKFVSFFSNVLSKNSNYTHLLYVHKLLICLHVYCTCVTHVYTHPVCYDVIHVHTV